MRYGKNKGYLICIIIDNKALRNYYETGLIIRNILNTFFDNFKSVFFSCTFTANSGSVLFTTFADVLCRCGSISKVNSRKIK